MWYFLPIVSYCNERSYPAGCSPLRSSSCIIGDLSRFSLFDERDLKLGGLFRGPREMSLGAPVSDLDLKFDGILCAVGGSSVGVSR